MNVEQQQALVHKALKGHAAAIELFHALAWASQMIDDYWDGDKPVSRDDMLRVVLLLTVDVPRNPFYLAAQDEMVGFIEDAMCFWMQASDLEDSACTLRAVEAQTVLQVSYITRSVVTDLLIRMARLVGGRQHEREIAMEVRRAVYSDNEPLRDYINEHLWSKRNVHG